MPGPRTSLLREAAAAALLTLVAAFCGGVVGGAWPFLVSQGIDPLSRSAPTRLERREARERASAEPAAAIKRRAAVGAGVGGVGAGVLLGGAVLRGTLKRERSAGSRR